MLFAVIFFWTPPHFWALAIRYRDDYAAADVPMLPVGGEPARTVGAASSPTRSCSGPSPSSSRRWPAWATSTWAPPSSSAAVFTWYAVRLLRTPDPQCGCRAAPATAEVEVQATAMRLFTWSITYITLLFGAMALDQLLRSGW